MPRLLIAGLFHETHTFLDGLTTLADFTTARDAELLRCKGDASPLGGVLELADTLGWEVIPAVDYRAQPSATVADEVFEAFWHDLEQRARPALAAGVDAIYLVLHGAMVTQSLLDVEGEVLARLRALPGGACIPLFGVFDLHAHFTPRMAQHSSCLVAYRENPHTDAREAGLIAAHLLQRALTTGEQPRTRCKHPGLIWPPTGTATAANPMKRLEAAARALEACPGIWSASVTAGFAFGDTPHTGVAFNVSGTASDEALDAALDELCALAQAHREEGLAVDPPVDEVLAKLTPVSGLTVLVEPSDNIGGGAPGDGTGLLRAMLQHELQNAAIAMADPAAVQQLASLKPGECSTIRLGGKGSRLDPGPVELEVEMVSRSDGRFELEDKNSHLASMSGDVFHMGPCAVVRHRGLTILISSVKTPPFDLGQWRSQGIDPATLSYIAVKAAVAHRRAYDPIAARMLWVDTPGPCSSRIEGFPYRHARLA